MAVGQPPLSYQWQRNGTNLAGATANSLTLAGVQYSDAGTYTLLVSNSAGQHILQRSNARGQRHDTADHHLSSRRDRKRGRGDLRGDGCGLGQPGDRRRLRGGLGD